jgi:hypothetical protein
MNTIKPLSAPLIIESFQWYKGTTKSNIFAHEVWEIST